MKISYLLILVFLLIIIVQTQKVVYDDQDDICYAKRLEIIKTYPRPKTRCEMVAGIEFERRYFHGLNYYCLIIDNRKMLYKNLTIEFNEPTEYEGISHDPEGFNKLVLFSGSNEKLGISENTQNLDYSTCRRLERGKTIKQHECLNLAAHYRFLVLNAPINFTINRVISLKIDGQESCDPALENVEDKFYANQINYNRNKYINECIQHNLKRSIPESNYCEALPEVNVVELLYNNQTKFWCISIDKPLTINKENEFYTVDIEVDNANKYLRWYGDFINPVGHNMFSFKVRDKFIASLEPKVYSEDTPNIISIKVDGQESCLPIEAQKDCGEQKINYQPLVAFGSATYPGKYPWHAGLFELQEKTDKKYICGGTIIGPKVILTAGHCVVRLYGVLEPSQLEVHVGQYNLLELVSATKIMRVHEIIVHEKFDFDYLENDITILKLVNSLVFNNYVQPICLSENDQAFDFSVGVVAGWGFNELNENQQILREAHMPIVSNNECRQSNREFFSKFLIEGKFCGGFRNGTIVCAGDSGGGLVFKFPNRWYIRGIVSLGVSDKGFCNLNEYVLFTDVVQYIKWIQKFL